MNVQIDGGLPKVLINSEANMREKLNKRGALRKTDDTAVEADGTARRWYTEPNGQTGLNTQPLLGSGSVSGAGIFELGGSWVSREQWHWIPSNGAPFTAQPFAAGPLAQDRAQSTMWVNLASPAAEWSAISASNGALIPAMSIPLSGTGTAICVAHNRPGTL